jgi:hypothetical protein
MYHGVLNLDFGFQVLILQVAIIFYPHILCYMFSVFCISIESSYSATASECHGPHRVASLQLHIVGVEHVSLPRRPHGETLQKRSEGSALNIDFSHATGPHHSLSALSTSGVEHLFDFSWRGDHLCPVP